MGLATTHGCFNGSGTTYNHWLRHIAKAAGLPPLDLMEDWYVPLSTQSLTTPPTLFDGSLKAVSFTSFVQLDSQLPIGWDCLKPDALFVLMRVTDGDGAILPEVCVPLADRLEAVLPRVPKQESLGAFDFREITTTFIAGLRLAASRGERVTFH